jgi:hypothetical protein
MWLILLLMRWLLWPQPVKGALGRWPNAGRGKLPQYMDLETTSPSTAWGWTMYGLATI